MVPLCMRGKKARAQKKDERLKGALVEGIVDEMHRGLRDVNVRRNASLSSKHTPNRKREIDVLLTVNVAECYTVNLAFECKNYSRAVNVEKIGEFADKLDDVGIGAQNGIFVSPSGFTRGALDRASQLGMRTLVLTGLSTDRLSALVVDALQSVVYLLPVVSEFEIINDVQTVTRSEDLWIWFDENGTPQVTTVDMLWHQWIDGTLSDMVGEHDVQIDAPPGWSQVVDGKPSIPDRVRLKVKVQAIVINVTGKATDHALVNAFDRSLTKRRVRASFDFESEHVPFSVFETEGDLAAYFEAQPQPLKILNRIRLPRVWFSGVFWPLSARVAGELRALAMKLKPGEQISSSDLDKLEKRPAAAWEVPASILR